jgi:DNA-directed RNA polymerase specialized sigma24 family protein
LLVNRLQHRRPVVDVAGDASGAAEPELQTAGGLSTVERSEQALALNVVLNLLDPADRDLLEQVYFRHVPIADLAARLGLARSALDMRLSRARRRLGEKMRSWSRSLA